MKLEKGSSHHRIGSIATTKIFDDKEIMKIKRTLSAQNMIPTLDSPIKISKSPSKNNLKPKYAIKASEININKLLKTVSNHTNLINKKTIKPFIDTKQPLKVSRRYFINKHLDRKSVV